MLKINTDDATAIYPVASDATISEGDFVSIADDGAVVIAANAQGVIVAGVADIVSAGRVRLAAGAVCAPNDTTSPITRADRGKPCYLADSGAVAAAGTVVAGLVVDVDDDGVWVAVTATALAAARANA